MDLQNSNMHVFKQYLAWADVVLLLIMFIALLIYPHYSSFDYQMTSRDQVRSTKLIRDRYYGNNHSTTVAVDELSQYANKVGYCYPVKYGGMGWGANDVSPMCNCLRNFHAEYVNYAKEIPDTTELSIEFRTDITKQLVNRCFKNGLRSTQYEELLPTSSLVTTNIVFGVVMWNSMSTIYSLKFRSYGKTWNIGLFITLVVLCNIPMLVLGIITEATASIILPWVALVLYSIYICIPWKRDSEKESEDTTPDSVSYWIQYGVNLASLIVAHNVVNQQRDYITNIMYIEVALIISLLQISVSFYESQQNFDEATQHAMSMGPFSWYCTVFLVIMLFSICSPTSMLNTFSNAADVASVVLILLLSVVVLKLPKLHAKQSEITDDGNKDLTVFTSALDFSAKAIFTVAVLCDVANFGSYD